MTNTHTTAVIPAQAGIQLKIYAPHSGTTPKGIFEMPKIDIDRYAEIFNKLDSPLRGNDGLECALTCRDSIDTMLKLKQRAVAGCA